MRTDEQQDQQWQARADVGEEQHLNGRPDVLYRPTIADVSFGHPTWATSHGSART
jgi:hypothetical protein